MAVAMKYMKNMKCLVLNQRLLCLFWATVEKWQFNMADT